MGRTLIPACMGIYRQTKGSPQAKSNLHRRGMYSRPQPKFRNSFGVAGVLSCRDIAMRMKDRHVKTTGPGLC